MANTLNSVVKKTTGNKKTRKELMQKSPIPWAVLLVVTLGAAGFLVWPNAADWMEKRETIKQMDTQIPQLESQKNNLNQTKNDLEVAFTDKAAPFIKTSEQRFPQLVDGTNVAQIIEIYSILMKTNYRSNTLDLKSLAVGKTQNVDGASYAETSVNINVVVDREMLEEFIGFIKRSHISDELRNKVIASGGGETASIEFLTLNKLPVARINMLSLNEESKKDKNNTESIYNAQLQVFFYSKPV